jgi:DNA-binding Lrp family transcriptional regulator
MPTVAEQIFKKVENRKELAVRRMEGQTIRGIAAEMDISTRTVQNGLKRQDVRSLIERETAEIIKRGLIPARRTITRFAAMGNSKEATDADKKLALEASKHITGIAGVSGTTPSVVINSLTQINQQAEQTEEMKAFQAFLMNQWGIKQEVVDVEG